MNKSKFLELIKNPDLVEEKDLTKLAELIAEHPYSQIIHVLSAKGHKILNTPEFEKALNLAAAYSYDRNVLYTIVEETGDTPSNGNLQVSTPSVTEPAIAEQPPAESEDSIIEEVSNFEWINEDPEEPEVSDEAEVDTKTEADVPIEPEVTEETIEDPSSIDIGDDVEDKEPDSEVEEKEADSEKEDPLSVDIEAAGIHAELMKNLSQLQESRQQYKELPDDADDPKNRKEQIEIIDNFIKNSPVLSKPNLSAESESVSQKDLSKNSAKLNDELASENLAKILLKQGKKKDAEKIYKKLINKFPQKKAYFADQIEKLKKK